MCVYVACHALPLRFPPFAVFEFSLVSAAFAASSFSSDSEFLRLSVAILLLSVSIISRDR